MYFSLFNSPLADYMKSDHMNCIIEPTAELGGLWLGNIDAA